MELVAVMEPVSVNSGGAGYSDNRLSDSLDGSLCQYMPLTR